MQAIIFFLFLSLSLSVSLSLSSLGLKCGPRRTYTLPTAIITSPQYPLMHSPREQCEYEIEVLPAHEVLLSTLHMQLPSSADCSEGDTIQVLKRTVDGSFDYGDAGDGGYDEDGFKELTRLCGMENYAPLIIRNSTHIRLRLSSSEYINGGRFKLRYEQVPEYLPL